ncbi:MAG: TrkA family potassium uptake protein [Opitutaceae bacterium]|nr:TrkA family potassium uptake protein [Opitutaceae bacterium]
MAKRTFIVGGGRFGSSLATRLSELGCEVVVAESSAHRAQELAEDGFRAVELDCEDADALRAAGALDADVVVVAVGENMKGSVLATLTLKEMKVKRLICRAMDERHAAVLTRLGADEVIVPGRDMAYRLAERIRSDSYSMRMPLPGDYQLGETIIGPPFSDRTLGELHLPAKYKVNVVLVSRRCGEEQQVLEPAPSLKLEVGDTVMVVGQSDRLDAFEKAARG